MIKLNLVSHEIRSLQRHAVLRFGLANRVQLTVNRSQVAKLSLKPFEAEVSMTRKYQIDLASYSLGMAGRMPDHIDSAIFVHFLEHMFGLIRTMFLWDEYG